MGLSPAFGQAHKEKVGEEATGLACGQEDGVYSIIFLPFRCPHEDLFPISSKIHQSIFRTE